MFSSQQRCKKLRFHSEVNGLIMVCSIKNNAPMPRVVLKTRADFHLSYQGENFI